MLGDRARSLQAAARDPADPADPAAVLALLGGSVSLVGLAFAFITYSLFSDVRDFGGVTLMNLLASLFLGQLIHIIVLGDPTLLQESSSCIVLSVCQQYAWLVQFFWLLAVAKSAQRFLSITSASSNQSSTRVHTTRLSSNEDSFYRTSFIYWGSPAIITAVIFIAEVSVDPSFVGTGCSFPMKSRVSTFATAACGIFIGAIIIVSILNARAMARGARQLLLSQEQFEHIELRLRFSVKLLLFLLVILSVGTVAAVLELDVCWSVFHALYSTLGVFTALLLTCDCNLIKSFNRAAFSRRRRKTKSNYGADTELVSTSNLDLLSWNNHNAV